MEVPRRSVFKNLAASLGLMVAGKKLGGATRHETTSSGESGIGVGSGGPDPLYEKPAPIKMAEFGARTAPGVSAVEVSDYAPGGYRGELKPSPSHADMNPGKAIIVTWKEKPHRFVFSHEASYDPWMELPNGVGLCNQFFEGNLGDAELMNKMGRKEKNSFVDVIQSGPQRVWVRWTYFAVNMNDDTKPRLRGMEDYFAYPNGLILRRLNYDSLMPQEVVGYSTQPIELFGVALITFAVVYGSLRALFQIMTQKPNIYSEYKLFIGRSLQLGLEFLVAADIIRTVVIDRSISSVLSLGLLVLIRTFLSWSIVVENEGRWPWSLAHKSE